MFFILPYNVKFRHYRITRVYPSLRGFAGEGSPFGYPLGPDLT